MESFMNLHKKPELFEQLILLTAEDKNIEPSIIEKDYYVTLFLKKLHKKEPDIIFKGGISLFKCHKIINRFSEDIDLNLDNGQIKLTEARRKKLKVPS